MSDSNSADFWEDIYRRQQAGWDLGGPTPVFRRLAASGRFAPGRMLVLGAGSGHDAREFARHGFEVTAVDFAQGAVQRMHELATPDAPVNVLHADLFALPPALDGTFDYVLEYVCFCAIDPARRPEYADVVARLLKPGGLYIDLAYPIGAREGGPPYSVTVEGVLYLFRSRGFTLLAREQPHDSIERRHGFEELLILEKQPHAGAQ